MGADETLAQVLDNGTGNPNTDLLDRAIEDASGDVASSVGNQYRIWTATGSFPHWIKRLAVTRAVYYCWLWGANGKAVPERIRQAFEDTERQLERIETGKKGLGDDPDPPARRSPARIDNSDGGRRAVYATWRRAGYLGAR